METNSVIGNKRMQLYNNKIRLKKKIKKNLQV